VLFSLAIEERHFESPALEEDEELEPDQTVLAAGD
jgi:hypothetical protein